MKIVMINYTFLGNTTPGGGRAMSLPLRSSGSLYMAQLYKKSVDLIYNSGGLKMTKPKFVIKGGLHHLIG